jgi:hypothetical protein
MRPRLPSPKKMMPPRIRSRSALPLLLVATLLAAFCAGPGPGKVRVEIPGRAPLDSNHGRPFLLTSFWLADDARKPELAQELKDYWTQELAVKLGRPVEALEVAIPGEDLFRQADFWKQLAGSVPGSVILTGRVAFTQETR